MNFRPACAALAIAVGVAISTISTAAHACSCLPSPPPTEAADTAHAVFEGKATGMTEDKPGGAYHFYEFEVLRQVKGEEAEKLSVRTASNSAACGRSFDIGQTYFVYARQIEGQLSVNACSRTRLIADAQADLVAFGLEAAEPDPEPAPPEPPRVEPAPPTGPTNTNDEPPAAASNARGCNVDDPGDAWPLLLLTPAWFYSRRRRHG